MTSVTDASAETSILVFSKTIVFAGRQIFIPNSDRLQVA
jgi:hypothetical protein